MNPILTEFRRLFPTVKITNKHERAAANAVNPAAVAAYLSNQADGYRALFDRLVGPGIATEADIAACVSLEREIRSVGNMSLDGLLYPLGPARAFELGRATGLIPTLYREELGREADPAGEAFWTETWTGQFRAGIR